MNSKQKQLQIFFRLILYLINKGKLTNTEVYSMTLNASNPELILDYILLMIERL